MKELYCPLCHTELKITHIGNEHTKSRRIKVKCPNCRIERTDATREHGFDWLEGIIVKFWDNKESEE